MRPGTARPGTAAARKRAEEWDDEEDTSFEKVIYFESFNEPKKIPDMNAQELIVQKNLLEQEVGKCENSLRGIDICHSGISILQNMYRILERENRSGRGY